MLVAAIGSGWAIAVDAGTFRTWLIVVACVVSGSSLLVLASTEVRRLERLP